MESAHMTNKPDGHSAPSTDVAGGARSDTPLTDAFIRAFYKKYPSMACHPENDEIAMFAAQIERSRAELLELLEELAQMAQDDAVVFGENSAWRPFYLIHAEKIRTVLARATAKG